jgi:uridylate kinase
MRIVVRIGGSVVGSPLNEKLIGKYIDTLKKLKLKGHQIVAVVGGGSLAREFIRIAGSLGLDESKRDWTAIHVSRLFANLFTMCLANVGCQTVPTSLDTAESYLEKGKIVVMGGLSPGMTTDTVAALIGERINADLLVKGSNVDGIYTKDPKKYSDAKKLDKLKFNDLSKFFELNRHKAGINQIIDPEAIKVLQRSKLRTIVVNGYDSENIMSAIEGFRIGTVIE